MKINIAKVAVVASMLATLALPLSAQAAGFGDKGINNRLERQHTRIEQGVRSHELTRRERERVASNDFRIRSQELRDNCKNGRLTRGEHRRLAIGLNRNSRLIYHFKHHHRAA